MQVNTRNAIRTTAAGFGLAGWLAAGTAVAAPYTFDGPPPASGLPLNNGGLVGQDGWQVAAGVATSNLNVIDRSSTDPTNVVQATGGTSGQFSRLNDSNFTFAPFTGTETNAILQYDVFIGSTAAESLSSFGPGTDGADAGTQIGNAAAELSATFGVQGTISTAARGSRYQIRRAANGTQAFAAVPATDLGDFVRLQLAIDYTANGGNGSGTLSKMNLTDGEASFTPVLTGIDLNLNAGPSETTFNGMYLRLVGGTGQSLLADNLSINGAIAPVPEPASLALLGLGGGLAMMRRTRR